jgi:hypothetical protein
MRAFFLWSATELDDSAICSAGRPWMRRLEMTANAARIEFAREQAGLKATLG